MKLKIFVNVKIFRACNIFKVINTRSIVEAYNAVFPLIPGQSSLKVDIVECQV